MRTLRLFFFIGFSLSLTIICSCDTNIFTGCENDYDFIVHNSLGFEILNKDSKENIFYIRDTEYNYDTLKFYKNLSPKIKIDNLYEIGFDGSIVIDFIDDSDRGVYNDRIEKEFYFYFNHEDQDTINIVYEFSKNNCKQQKISYFKIAYNDSTYFDGHTNYVPQFQFLK